MTLVDFPGRVATTVFTRGCSFRCGFCHNPELVIPEKFNPLLSEDQFFRFLESRLGKIQGVCITGGEPTIQADIMSFISHIKALGFDVKLDTNGSMPEALASIIEDGDVDYIAMDIKSPLDNYSKVTGAKQGVIARSETTKSSEGDPHGQSHSNLTIKQYNNLESKILASIDLIMNSGIDYEFRTTVCHPYHKSEDFEGIGKLIKGAKRYYIQNFVPSKQISSKIKFEPFTEQELEKSLKIIKKHIKHSEIRNF